MHSQQLQFWKKDVYDDLSFSFADCNYIVDKCDASHVSWKKRHKNIKFENFAKLSR